MVTEDKDVIFSSPSSWIPSGFGAPRVYPLDPLSFLILLLCASVYLRPINQSCFKTYIVRTATQVWTDRQTQQRGSKTLLNKHSQELKGIVEGPGQESNPGPHGGDYIRSLPH